MCYVQYYLVDDVCFDYYCLVVLFIYFGYLKEIFQQAVVEDVFVFDGFFEARLGIFVIGVQLEGFLEVLLGFFEVVLFNSYLVMVGVGVIVFGGFVQGVVDCLSGFGFVVEFYQGLCLYVDQVDIFSILFQFLFGSVEGFLLFFFVEGNMSEQQEKVCICWVELKFLLDYFVCFFCVLIVKVCFCYSVEQEWIVGGMAYGMFVEFQGFSIVFVVEVIFCQLCYGVGVIGCMVQGLFEFFFGISQLFLGQEQFVLFQMNIDYFLILRQLRILL